jgi:hypothetical protein
MRAGMLARMAGFLVISGAVLMVSGVRWGGAGIAHQIVFAQTSQPPMGGQSPAMPPGRVGVNDPMADSHDPERERMRQQLILSVNEARHKRMEEDAAKLLALSTELKADVDKAGKDELSVEVIRKAGEIEKLAHDVKERMRQ